MNKKKMTFRFLNKVDSSKCFKIPPKNIKILLMIYSECFKLPQIYILKMNTFNKCSTR